MEPTLALRLAKQHLPFVGSKPEKFLTDGGNNSGQIMDEMEQREVEFYAPVESSQPAASGRRSARRV